MYASQARGDDVDQHSSCFFLLFIHSLHSSVEKKGEKMSSSSADEPLSFAPPPVDHNFSYQFCVFIICSGEFYLGYSRQELLNVSWYQLLHWDFMKEAQSKHRLSKQFIYKPFLQGWQLTLIYFLFTVTQSEQDRSCILLVRLQRRNGSWLWIHCVLQVKFINWIYLQIEGFTNKKSKCLMNF